MAALTNQSIATSYEQLLHVDNDGGGNGTALVSVKDGDNGTTFDIQLSSNSTNFQTDFQIGGTAVTATAAELNYNDIATLGTAQASKVLTADANGIALNPNQPAFSAYNSASNNNVTGDGTVFTVEFDTEVFDQGSDYNNTTDTFTAPVAGRYLLSCVIRCSGVLAAHTSLTPNIVTSNRSYTWNSQNTMNDFSDEPSVGFTVLADMDASDTATVTIAADGGTKVIDIVGTTGPNTQFQGYLVA